MDGKRITEWTYKVSVLANEGNIKTAPHFTGKLPVLKDNKSSLDDIKKKVNAVQLHQLAGIKKVN